MFRLHTMSVLEFSGNDAGHFLHNQLSADIKNIAIGDAGFACCCNPAGRVLGLLLVCPKEDSILVVCSSSLATSLVEWLSRFIIRADVKIKTREDLVVMAGEELPAGAFTVCDLDYAIVPAADFSDTSTPSDEQAWKVNELKKGIVWLDEETSATFLPQMLGYENIGALNFQKGCFPGQEIIARTRYLGKLKRRPLLVHSRDSVHLGTGAKVTLYSGEISNTAVVVDSASGASGDEFLFLVARIDEGTHPDRMEHEGQNIPILTA
ncbi:MAG: folate-binding protein YgfZ [Lysobacterales bacterium]|jgi:folate-binding protein YgfZ